MTTTHPGLSDDSERCGIPDFSHESSTTSNEPQSSVSPDTPSSQITSATLGQIHYGGQHLGQISLENGFPKFSKVGQKWIFSRTGEPISFQVPGDMPFAKALSCPHKFPGLPPRKTTESIVSAYLRSSFKLVLPLIDDLLFADTVTLAYCSLNGSASLEHIISKCCVLAFVSLTDLFRTAKDEFSDVESDACALEARHILTNILEEPNITTLQSVLILVRYKIYI